MANDESRDINEEDVVSTAKNTLSALDDFSGSLTTSTDILRKQLLMTIQKIDEVKIKNIRRQIKSPDSSL